MENSDLTPDTEEKKTPRRKNTGEFLALWLRGRQSEISKHAETEEDDDDDDSESSSERPIGRLRRLAKGLFKGLVVKEAVEPKPESLLESMRRKTDAQPTGAKSSLLEPHDLSLGLKSESSETVSNDADVETKTEGETEDTESSDSAADETSAETGQEDDPEEAESRDEDAPDDHTAAAGGGSKPPRRPGFGSPSPVILAPPTHERVIIERETMRERGNNRLAAIALLATGAEYIGRRRADSKIRKEVVKNREEDYIKHREGQVKLEQLARKSQDQLKEVLAREQKYEMQISEKKSAQPERPSVRTERAATPREIIAEKYVKKISQPEHTPQSVSRPERFSTLEQSMISEAQPQSPAIPSERAPIYQITPEDIRPAPEFIEDKPIELIYERSHEIKDDKFSFIGGGTQLYKNDPAVVSRNDPSSIPSTGNSGSSQPLSKEARQRSKKLADSLYAKAAISGIGAASVLILFAILAYLATT